MRWNNIIGNNEVWEKRRNKKILEKVVKDWEMYFNPLIAGGSKEVTHTLTNLQRSAAGLCKYVWPFCFHQALKV